MSWRRSQRKKTRRKTSIALPRYIQCIEAFWDRSCGYRPGHSSGSIHDLAHIPTQNCLADCLTKASAKADNLITAVKTRKLLDVHIHPDFRTLMEHKAFLSTWCRTFMHTREKEVFFLNTLKISCTNSPRRTTSGDVCGDSADRGAKGIEHT